MCLERLVVLVATSPRAAAPRRYAGGRAAAPAISPCAAVRARNRRPGMARHRAPSESCHRRSTGDMTEPPAAEQAEAEAPAAGEAGDTPSANQGAPGADATTKADTEDSGAAVGPPK